jgi:hypothetical protein
MPTTLVLFAQGRINKLSEFAVQDARMRVQNENQKWEVSRREKPE